MHPTHVILLYIQYPNFPTLSLSLHGELEVQLCLFDCGCALLGFFPFLCIFSCVFASLYSRYSLKSCSFLLLSLLAFFCNICSIFCCLFSFLLILSFSSVVDTSLSLESSSISSTPSSTEASAFVICCPS